MSEAPEQNETLRFRVERIEAELERLRERQHDLADAIGALRLVVQRIDDTLSHVNEDVRSLKRAFYTFAFGAVSSAIVFALGVFALLGHH